MSGTKTKVRAKAKTKAKTEPEKKPKKKKKGKKLLIALVLLLALLVLSGGVLAALGMSVTGGDEIFPNVIMDGIPVGGMTISQAAQRLAAPMEESNAERAVTVRFPGGSSISVRAEEAGIFLTGEDAAYLAFQHGRDRGSISNFFTYIQARFSTVDLDPFSMVEPNQNMIRAAVAAAAEELHLAAGEYELTESSLILIKGTRGVSFDEREVAEIISEAFSEGARAPIDLDAETTDPEEVDLHALYTHIASEAENAFYDIELDEVGEHVMGVSFDLSLAQRLMAEAHYGDEVVIPLILTEPDITADFLREVLFRDQLARSTTNLTADENRNTNIQLASEEINGLVLNPGDQFCFNEVVQRRTAERGFRPGGAFFGTETRQVIGGGICQVSSTIYHALLHTEIQVDVRQNHTLVVAYLPLGMDAAVSWGGPEFRFTNNTDFPLRLVTYREGRTMNVSIYGTNTSIYARIVPETVHIGSTPYTTTYEDHPGLPAGTTHVYRAGRVGQVAEVYQRFYDEAGNLVRRELVSRNNYSPIPALVHRGTGPADPDPPYPPEPPDPPPPDPPPPDPPPPPPDDGD